MAFSYTYTITVNTPEDWNKVNQNFADVKTVLNNGITGTDHLSASAAIADTQLASPNNVAYKNLCEARGMSVGAQTAGAYMFSSNSGSVFVSPVVALSDMQVYSLAAADLAVAGKTTKVRVRALVGSNATAAGINYTFGLYPVTIAGAAGNFSWTLGTVVSGTTAAINAPSASTFTTVASSDVTIPADGAYSLGVVLSGTQSANCALSLRACVQVRNV